MASKENFFKAHWDWLVAGAGLALLAASAALFAVRLGTSPEDGARRCEMRLKAAKHIALLCDKGAISLDERQVADINIVTRHASVLVDVFLRNPVFDLARKHATMTTTPLFHRD